MDIFGRRWSVFAGIIFFILSPGSASANSKFLNVQGRLTDTSGNPLTGNHTVTFRLYTSSTGGSATWTESQSIALSTGLFNVALGSVTALDSLSFDQLYYLGIQVAGDANELSPRQQLGASAYAQGSLGDFNVGHNLVASSSVIAGAASLNSLVVSTITASGSVGISGNLTIGGQGIIAGQSVIAGTMTVQGSAFSVGGATFSVAGGSVTLGGRLNAAAAGIKWADGTTSITASPTGAAVLNATQTFSGANTFLSSVTFSNTASIIGVINRSTKTLTRVNASTTADPPFSGCNMGISTLTLTTGNVSVDIKVNVPFLHSVAYTEGCQFYVLLDGALYEFVAPYGFGYIRPANIHDYRYLRINHRTDALSAGNHTFCLGMADNGGGTCTTQCSTYPCQFEIREAH